jgi:hypothetical protein
MFQLYNFVTSYCTYLLKTSSPFLENASFSNELPRPSFSFGYQCAYLIGSELNHMLHTCMPTGNKIEFQADFRTTWQVYARAVPTFEEQHRMVHAKSVSNGISIFPLPIFWSSVSKLDGLQQLSESVKAAVTSPLNSAIEWLTCVLSTVNQLDHLSPCELNQGIEVVECSVLPNCGQRANFASNFKQEKLSGILKGESAALSAIHDIGLPERCTDIVYLLIDDLLHKTNVRVDRYYRVWCSSGKVMLVSSTTARSFNATGNLVEVKFSPKLHQNSLEIYRLIRVTADPAPNTSHQRG